MQLLEITLAVPVGRTARAALARALAPAHREDCR